MDRDIILTQGTRILMPTEYNALKRAMLTQEQRERIKQYIDDGNLQKANRTQRYPIICDMLLQTGMRLVEARAMHRDWYRAPRRVVVIPKGACKKVRCTFSERTVMLSLPGCDAVDRYLQSGVSIPATSNTFRDALIVFAKRADIGTAGITPKMFRKTLVSWLMACYPEREMYISASMGHDRYTLQKHYLGVLGGVPRMEVELMREYLKDWGMRL